jgi:hypothetical protein
VVGVREWIGRSSVWVVGGVVRACVQCMHDVLQKLGSCCSQNKGTCESCWRPRPPVTCVVYAGMLGDFGRVSSCAWMQSKDSADADARAKMQKVEEELQQAADKIRVRVSTGWVRVCMYWCMYGSVHTHTNTHTHTHTHTHARPVVWHWLTGRMGAV